LNQIPKARTCELMRLNMLIPPSDDPERLGVLKGDTAGFPAGAGVHFARFTVGDRVVVK
jgi:hypothetical protein